MILWVVDDCRAWAVMIREIAPAGVDVVHVPTVLEMFTRLQYETPDALLLDLHFRCDAATGHDAAASAKSRKIPFAICTDGEPEMGPPGTLRKEAVFNDLPGLLRRLGMGV